MEDKDCKFEKCRCEGTDAWYVNAPRYNNCFWTYILFNSRPHTLNEISQLTDLSISAVTSVEKKALKKIQKRINKDTK